MMLRDLVTTSQVVRFRRSGQGLRGSGQGVVRSGADHFKRIIISALPCETVKRSEFWQACIGGKNTDVPVYAILLIRVASLLDASEDKPRSHTGLCAGRCTARQDKCAWIAALVVVIYAPALSSFLAADIHG